LQVTDLEGGRERPDSASSVSSANANKRRRRRVAASNNRTATSIDVDGVEQSKMQYDSTGMYHWCPSRNIEACLMDRQDAAMTVLQV
jgi:potassium large conductance calcium-activated channel subfamily M alpha protein 1